MQNLTIENVDVDLLMEQFHQLEMMPPVMLTFKQQEAIQGLLNMRDAISDSLQTTTTKS